MSKDHQYIGIAAGEHKEAEKCVVIKYAVQIITKEEEEKMKMSPSDK